MPAIALPAHTRFEMIRTTEAAPRVAAELGALVGVNQRPSWSPSTNGHQHGIEHEFAMDRRLSGPAHDQAGEQIHDDSQIEPPSPRLTDGPAPCASARKLAWR